MAGLFDGAGAVSCRIKREDALFMMKVGTVTLGETGTGSAGLLEVKVPPALRMI